MQFDELLKNVVIASFATVGLIEFLKNFIKVEKKWIYALLMLPISALCFFCCIAGKDWGIGAVLTVGMTQLCYQTIVQTMQGVVKRIAGDKVVSTGSTTENNNSNIEEDKDE